MKQEKINNVSVENATDRVSKKSSTKKVGRPTKFEDRFVLMAAKACSLGATDDDLGELFSVDTATIQRWKLEYPIFCDSIKNSKSEKDEKVERSLLERALGYEHADTDIRTVSVGDGCSQIVQTPIMKKYPPSEAACIFWLKNRQPKRWRDKQELVHENPDGSNLIPSELVEAAVKIAKGL